MLEPVRRTRSLGADTDTGENPGPIGVIFPSSQKEQLLDLPVALGLASSKQVVTVWATQTAPGMWDTPKGPPTHNIAVYEFSTMESLYREKLHGELPPYLLIVSAVLETDSAMDDLLADTKYKRASPAQAFYFQKEESVPIPKAYFMWWVNLRDMTESSGKSAGLASVVEALGGEAVAGVLFGVSEPYTELRKYPAMSFNSSQNTSLTDISPSDQQIFTSPVTTPSSKSNVFGPVALAVGIAAATYFIGKAVRR